jgi:lipocalin
MLCIALSIHGVAQQSSNMKQIDNTPVTGFELDRYLGTWYEIARFPHTFEKNLTGVSATYSLKKNGKIEVLNAGYKESLNGPFSQARGKAKAAGDPDVGHLKVSFFLFFYADYYIMELDKENYQWALVGSDSPNYLWLLSRTPSIPDSLYDDLTNRALKRGYSLEKLSRVPQHVD